MQLRPGKQWYSLIRSRETFAKSCDASSFVGVSAIWLAPSKRTARGVRRLGKILAETLPNGGGHHPKAPNIGSMVCADIGSLGLLSVILANEFVPSVLAV